MPEFPRTVLVHLNVQVPPEDSRTPDQIGEAIAAAIEVGSDNETLDGLVVVVALCDEN